MAIKLPRIDLLDRNSLQEGRCGKNIAVCLNFDILGSEYLREQAAGRMLGERLNFRTYATRRGRAG